MAAHGRWYIADRDPRYLRRNALVALGNVGDGSDPATERALRRWLSVDDEMIVEHARWAARELGRDDLVAPEATVTHLLVTNDFPPKVGGIQAYLWELWRRLDPDSFAVLTASSHPDAAAFDREQAAPGHPHRAGADPGARPRTPAGPSHPGDGPTDRRRPGRPRSGLPPRSHRSPARHPLRRAAPRCRGRHPRPPARRARQLVAHVLRPQRRWPCRPAAIRPPRPAGPSAGGADAARWWRFPRGSTSSGSDRSRRTSAASARAESRPPGRRTAGGERQPAGAPQGDGRAHRRRRSGSRPTCPT